MASRSSAIILAERIERAILVVRGERVMLDSTLAELYGVTTRRLNEQFRRNRDRFPDDFAYQLTQQEFTTLMSQIATSKIGRGGRRKLPWVFTEHGAVMLANVVNSEAAIRTSVQIVRVFIRLRKLVIEHADLARRLDELEARYDAQFKSVFNALRELTSPPASEPREMGYHTLIDRK